MSTAFNEVQEELRQQRLYDLWRRYGNLLIGFIVSVILITAGISAQKYFAKEKRLSDTKALYAMLDDTAFPANLDTSAVNTGPKVIALFKAAKAEIDAGNTDKATAHYQEIAALKHSEAKPFHGLAILMLARLSPDQTADLLTPLANNMQSIWKDQALFELAAYEASALGNFQGAIDKLNQLQTNAKVPSALLNKAQALAHVYSVQLKSQAE